MTQLCLLEYLNELNRVEDVILKESLFTKKHHHKSESMLDTVSWEEIPHFISPPPILLFEYERN